jgi:hypothetical protein
MLNCNSPIFTDNSIYFPLIEYNSENLSSFSSMSKIFNDAPNYTYMNESENLNPFISIKPIEINKDRPYFKTELLKQKRGKKRNKESKKAEHTSSILIIL